MPKLTKEVTTRLERIAAILEETYGPEAETHFVYDSYPMTVTEARLTNLKLPKNLSGDPQEMITLRQPREVNTPVNRVRRLKKAYERAGEEGVNHYLKPYLKGQEGTIARQRLADRMLAAQPEKRELAEQMRPKKKKGLLARLVDKARELNIAA